MKIRSGFVSNSSSSSFLLVGVKKDELTSEQLTMANSGGLEEHGGLDEPYFIGEEWYIGEYETKGFCWDDVQNAYDKVRNVLGCEVDIKVYVGTRWG
ncbi:hypothetical protein LCGC14_1167390 [marine sediment metagenome]|uniref:Uncharacterized protein n=1 Tax=marine sediment metagenome TaxID=412755 RepID=A0A0F9LVP5_9ZZZZ